MSKLPIVFLLHPVGVGATSAMNVLSAKLWFRALVDLLPDVALAAPWLLYAEALVDHDRRLRDARVFAEGCHGVIAVGGEAQLRHTRRVGVVWSWREAKDQPHTTPDACTPHL